MNERFAFVAGRLAGVACRLLAWKPQEFWECTPAELAAIFDPLAEGGQAPVDSRELARLMEQDND